MQFEGKKAGTVHFKTRFEATPVASVPDSAPEEEAVEKSTGDKSKPSDDAEETKDAPKAEEAEKTEATDASAKPSPSGEVVTENGGELRIHVIEAKLTRDTEYFGQMDPYVEIKTSVEKKKTVTHNDGGRTPVWNEELTFDVAQVDDEIEILV